MYGKQTKYYRLEGFQIQTLLARGILTCFQSCLKHEKCESINFDNYSGVCELNSKSLSGSEQLIYRQGNIFVQLVAIKRQSSCAEIHQTYPSASSGYYWIYIGQVKVQVYCDMKTFGGGWTLVVSISSTNNQHLQRAAVNCFDLELCVPFDKQSMTTRKLSDQHIHHLANCEGTFRLDVFQGNYSVFYQIPQGAENFNSACRGETDQECPRIIISNHYPYKWETNTCTSLDVGYHIGRSIYHRVFDGHDDEECGTRFQSSLYGSRRGLYGSTVHGNKGIYNKKNGMLYVK
ncbi:unnamed protein product [Porites evermanni]|uniref:Apple domain-containing protein n=1 Tax=Porites evermanni TaxID=104178 RepID=A0ABN8LLA2_9CNID|nr:unnamed protein product [Porites evermanni]